MKKTLFFAVVLALLVGLLPGSMLLAEGDEYTQEIKVADVTAEAGSCLLYTSKGDGVH